MVVQNANGQLPTKYATLMHRFDSLTADQVEALVDEIIDEIELEEIRLKKQDVMFGVID